MKKDYMAPQLEVEEYELSTSIASNCNVVVDNGPDFYFNGHQHQTTVCTDYYNLDQDMYEFEDVEVEDGNSSNPNDLSNVNFYDSGCCDCYTTGSGAFWTS
ncbi:MAG: hypothetical protein LUH02_01390 [Erysipelotrichaceae bacterium]|nr:hypothetical protein [Erysipelotrichaceae bacterium]